jgi:hypothetical protein
MNAQKYHKIYLQKNKFVMIKEKINIPRCFPCPYSINFQRSHPKVLSGEAFWITHNKLCVGYNFETNTNTNIFRPIFSHKRQRLLDRIHKFNGINKTDKGNTIDNPKKFWNKVKSKYFIILFKVKKLPIVCIEKIINMIY